MKNGRSGHPVQKEGARGGSGLGQVAAGHGGFAVKGFRAVRDLGDAPHQDIVAGGNVTGVHPRRAGGLDVTSQAGAHQFRGVLTGLLEHVLAVYLGLHVAPAQGNVDFLFDVVGRAFLDDQHRALGGAELGDLLGHQRKGGVEHEKGNAALAESVGQAKLVEGGDHRVVKAALKDDPDFLGRIVAEDLVDGVLDDEAARRRQPLLHLVLLVLEQRRAVVDAAGREGGGRIERVLAADLGLDVVAADKTAVQVRGADAQHQHHRHVAGLGKPEALLHHVDDVLLFGPGVEERHGAFEGERVGALLDDAGALAVVLADDDQGTADDADRGDRRQRVRRDVGADHRLPGHGAAHRVVDRGRQHGRRRRFAGRRFEVDAELVEDVLLGVGEHVENVADGSALIAAHVCDARLQKPLDHRHDVLAVHDITLSVEKGSDLAFVRNFHELISPTTRPWGRCPRRAKTAMARTGRNFKLLKY